MSGKQGRGWTLKCFCELKVNVLIHPVNREIQRVCINKERHFQE